MAKENELSFGKVAIQQGYCTRAQLEDALRVLNEVKRLGLQERLGNIMVKKKYMTREQVKTILRHQGQKSTYKIAGYEILEKIGQGGMGAVFKARQTSLDRIVALKILSPKLGADREFVDRFIKEAQVVAKLSHPNIIVGIDVGRDGKYCYFAMEFVDGPTTLSILQDEGPLEEARALRIALQIAKALEHADRHGLVHRDIKPDNIMIASRDEAKLCDLGLAKKAESDAGMTQAGAAVGTPHYISPEQARGEVNVRITADFYGLGATLYHLMTGQTLFEGDNATTIMTKHLLEEAPSARSLRSSLSEPFCQLLVKMLARDPGDRHQTPQELIADLERVIDGQPIKSPLPSGAKSSMARSSRGAGRGAGRAAGLPPGVGRATSGPRLPLDRPDPTTIVRRPVKSSGGMHYVAAAAGLLVLAVLGGMLMGRSPGTTSNVKGRTAAEKRESREAGKGAGEQGSHAEAPKAVVVRQPERVEGTTPKPAKIEKWEPLEKARRFRKENPTDFLKQVQLYEAAVPGAPHAVVSTIHLERDAAEQQLNAVFSKHLETHWKDVESRMKKLDFAGALNVMVAKSFPADLLTERNRGEIANRRKQVEQKLVAYFERVERPRLEKAFQKAGGIAGKLSELRTELKALRSRFVAKPIHAFLDGMVTRINKRAEQARRFRAQAFTELIGRLREKSVAGDLVGALEVVAAEGKGALAADFGKQLQTVENDLKSIQARLAEACRNLGAKKGTPEIVSLRASGILRKGRVVDAVSSPKSGPGIVLADHDGALLTVYLAKVDADHLMRYAGLGGASSTKRQHAKGVYLFWRGGLIKARAGLVKARKDGAPAEAVGVYLAWMERRAGDLIKQVEERYRSVLSGKLADADRKRQRDEARSLIQILDRDFRDTEVYLARKRK